MAVNVIGCFAIGLCGALLAGAHLRAEFRPFILIGVLGSFTTFSTYGYETFELVNNGQFVVSLTIPGDAPVTSSG